MKKNKNFAFGFTVAELLITMLISALVAAAMVPVIGLKKVKAPKNRFNHGIAECYYEPTGFNDSGDATDWHLTFFYADNSGHKSSGGGSVGEDYCTFQPPKAEYFEIIAIGAGTDGVSKKPENFSIGIGTGEDGPQPIHIDHRFQKDLSDAYIWTDKSKKKKKYIRNELVKILDSWNRDSSREKELLQPYILYSPIGRGGNGVCRATYTGAENCDCPGGYCPQYGGDYEVGSALSTKPQVAISNALNQGKCYFYNHGSGGDSGKQMVMTGRKFQITPEMHVDEATANYSKTSLRIRWVYQLAPDWTSEDKLDVTLKASANGADTPWDESLKQYKPVDTTKPAKDAECVTPYGQCTGTQIIDKFNKGKKYGTVGPAGGCTTDSGLPTKGKIYYGKEANDANLDPAVLHWTYSPLSASAKTGSKGSPGKEKSIVYENLKGKLYLMPAGPADKEHFGANNVSFVRLDKDDEKTTLVSAESGYDFGLDGLLEFDMLNSDIPMPAKPLEYGKIFNKNAFNYTAKLSATPFEGGLKGCETVDGNGIGEWCPGFAGKGIYYYFDSIPDLASISITHRDYPDKPYALSSEKIKKDKEGENEKFKYCDNGITEPTSLQTVEYTAADSTVGYFTPKYCQEPKTKGSPGAIIIMW